jgi:hypothetical protein
MLSKLHTLSLYCNNGLLILHYFSLYKSTITHTKIMFKIAYKDLFFGVYRQNGKAIENSHTQQSGVTGVRTPIMGSDTSKFSISASWVRIYGHKDLIFISVVSFKYGLIIHDDFVSQNLSIVYKIRLYECVYLILFIVQNLLSY